jgi:prepilin-type N-terminal cleavage/methylation domain-containing protein
MSKPCSSGFTIVEVMIVLAVTGLLFLSAAALISGRTDQTEFDQSIRAVQQQIQQTINEVSAGDYPNDTNYTCVDNNNSLSFATGGQGQGTNQNCIFLGTAMQFGVGPNGDSETTYTLAGLRQSGGDEVTDLAQAIPAIVAPNGNPDAQTLPLDYGLHTYGTSMNYSINGGGLTPIGAVAFVYSLASYGQANTINSGSQHVNVVPIRGSQLGDPSPVTTIDGALPTLDALDASSGTAVTICFASATTSQYGLITIGGNTNSNNGQLGVTLSIIDKTNGSTCP